MATRTPKPKRRRERGDDGISWDKVNKCYVGTISLGYDDDRQAPSAVPYAARPSKRSRTSSTSCTTRSRPASRHPATYTVRQCVMDWLDSLELDPHTMATYRGQAEKWIYPKIGAKKLADFKATDADRFFRDVAKVLSKVIAGEDQEHAGQVDPPSAEVRPHRPGTSPSSSTCRRASRGTRRAP